MSLKVKQRQRKNDIVRGAPWGGPMGMPHLLGPAGLVIQAVFDAKARICESLKRRNQGKGSKL